MLTKKEIKEYLPRTTNKMVLTVKYIKDFVKKNKRKPTVAELQRHFRLSTISSAWERYERSKRLIKKCPYCNRSL